VFGENKSGVRQPYRQSSAFLVAVFENNAESTTGSLGNTASFDARLLIRKHDASYTAGAMLFSHPVSYHESQTLHISHTCRSRTLQFFGI